MATKKRPLTASQTIMVTRLTRYHSAQKPFLPATAAEQRTCDSLDARGLLNGRLILVKQDVKRGVRDYKRAVWMKEQA